MKHPFIYFGYCTWTMYSLNLVISLKFWSNIWPISCQSRKHFAIFLQFLISNFSFFLYIYLFIYLFLFYFFLFFIFYFFYLGWGFVRNWVIRGIQWMVCWWVLVHSGPKECKKNTHSLAFAHTSSLGEWRIKQLRPMGWVGGWQN